MKIQNQKFKNSSLIKNNVKCLSFRFQTDHFDNSCLQKLLSIPINHHSDGGFQASRLRGENRVRAMPGEVCASRLLCILDQSVKYQTIFEIWKKVLECGDQWGKKNYECFIESFLFAAKVMFFVSSSSWHSHSCVNF